MLISFFIKAGDKLSPLVWTRKWGKGNQKSVVHLKSIILQLSYKRRLHNFLSTEIHPSKVLKPVGPYVYL